MQKSNLVLQDIVNHAMKKLGVANYGGAMHLMMYPTHLSEAVKELIPNHSPDNIVNRILQGDYGPSTLCTEVLSDFNAPNAPNQHSVASISRDLALKLAHFGKAYDIAGGTIYAGYVDSPDEIRFNSFMAKSKPPLIILTEGEKITGFFPINPKDKSDGDYADFCRRFKLDQLNQKPVAPVQTAQAPAKPVQPIQAQQALPKNLRRIDGSKRKLYHVEGSHFYPPYVAVMVAIGDSPQNSEIYTEDGGKFYLGIKRYNHMKQGERAGLNVAPINPNNPASKMALAHYKIALI